MTPTVTPTRKKKSRAEDALAKLQRLMRVKTRELEPGFLHVITVPSDIAADVELRLTRQESDALEKVPDILLEDLSLEHLGDSAKDLVRRFAARSVIDRERDHVAGFLAENARELETRICYVTIDYLKVESPVEVAGIQLLPVEAPEVPHDDRLPGLLRDAPIGSVAAVEVTGTNRSLMSERGRTRVAHALRVLRIALREHRGINDKQLRFRLGRAYALGPDLSGWQTPTDVAYELELDESLIDLANQQAVTSVPLVASTGLEKQVHISIRWMERARFTGEPIVALLYLFFALEALLGDISEGEKAHALAFRQAMLGQVVTGQFTHPNETLFLYDVVRSAAVHGEAAPDIDDRSVSGFWLTVRWTLDHVLRFAGENRIARRSDLLRALDNHADRQQLENWLTSYAGSTWQDYFNKTKSKPSG